MNLLFPKNTKHSKVFKGKVKGLEMNANKIHFGYYGLKALEPGRITSRQIEAARKAVVRKTKKFGNLYINIFPNVPVSAKPAEIRMGKGKGGLSYWACKIKPGKILYELSNISPELAKSAFISAAAKLPILTKIIKF
jgi:large subunit ribosomal protein L16